TYQAYAYACRNVRWKLAVLMDESQLMASVPQLMAHIVQASVISFALLALLVTFLSYSITNPVGKLVRSMRSIRGDDAKLPKPPQTRRRDEIGDLYGSFALMIGRIEALLHRQQETERARHTMELKVLQSQISPHFLYNSLNTLGSLAAQGRAEEIPQTTAAL
ncbi:MAG TPA: histidine kinase, partial [Clostridia bacterium]|nr:histidine kinase [Clostridia bacterium]